MPVQTPCIGLCSTVFGDQVCRGCKRYADEIVAWNGYNQDEKRIVHDRLESHLLQIFSDKFKLEDQALFERKLQDNNVRYMRIRKPLCWINDLLRTNVLEQSSFEEFGVSLANDLKAMSVSEIIELVDNEVYALSEAHYQRYVAVSE